MIGSLSPRPVNSNVRRQKTWMNLRRLKALEIGSYLVGGLSALFFRIQSGDYQLDWYLIRDGLDTFIAPYGIFIIAALLLSLSKSIHLAVLSLAVSILVLAYTLIAYIRVLYVLKCDPRVCWVFVGTPIVLFVGGLGLLILGIVGIGVYSQLTKIGV
jgi:hypothetical protein